MDLNVTRMFVGAVQAGSLSAAAARLNLPLPTISRRIRQLEQQLKVQLLERSPKGIALTDAGARLYEHASAAGWRLWPKARRRSAAIRHA